MVAFIIPVYRFVLRKSTKRKNNTIFKGVFCILSWICPYCKKKPTEACLHQKQYENAAKKLDITTFEIFCSAGLTISERSLFEALIPPKSMVLEIGCGTFHRTGPYYTQNSITFFGIEPLQNIALRSDYREHIVVASFGLDFLRRFPKILEKKFTAIVILGGMINGLHCPTLRDSFWKALGILSKNCEVIILDTLVRPKEKSLYRKSMQGGISSNKGTLPIQYYFTRKELQRIFELYGFTIAVEGIDILGVGTKIFALKGGNWCQNPFSSENNK